MVFAREFQINKTGKSHGLTIPTGFRIGVIAAKFNPKEDGTIDFVVYAGTYKDDNYTERIHNDDIPWRNVYNMPKADLGSSVVTLFNNTFKADLDTKYTAGNVVVV